MGLTNNTCFNNLQYTTLRSHVAVPKYSFNIHCVFFAFLIDAVVTYTNYTYTYIQRYLRMHRNNNYIME